MRRFTIAFTAALFAVVSFAAPGSIQAAEKSEVIARIVERGELRVGMSGDQAPLNFKSKDGTMMGLEVDLAKAMGFMMNVEPKLVQKPFGELLAALEAGEVDLVISGMTITPARNMRAAFVGPYHLTGKSILTKSSTLAEADETADLDQADLKLAALAGSTSEDFVKAFLPKAQLTATKDYETAIQLLKDDKVQAVVADQEKLRLESLLNPKAGLVTLSQPLTIEPIGIAVAPGDSLFLNLIENSLGALEAANLLEGLRGRWLQSGAWLDQLP